MSEQFLHGINTTEITDGTRPIQTVKSSVIGLIGTAPDADAKVFPLNRPVALLGQQRLAKKLGDKGTLKNAIDDIFDQVGAVVVVVRVAEGTTTTATMTSIVGDGTTKTGVHAFLGAQTQVGLTPRILVAPGFTAARAGNAANPVVAELEGIAKKLRAVIFADGPATTFADAVKYRKDWSSDRIFVIDPNVMVFDTKTAKPVARPASARVAGVQAWLDNNRGFWWSPSNQIIKGVVGVSRPIDFALSNLNAEANLLNEKQITTIIQNNGFRVWGNRTTGTDSKWAFLSVRRTADVIYDSIEQAMLWAMDRPFSAQLVEDISGSVNAYLRHLKAQGGLLGGRAWLDQELNTKETLQAGKLYIDFDIEPPAPLERLSFRAHRNAGYYEELIAKVQQNLSRT